ncbi:MAG: DUF2062 domain-containing protein [Chromatiales bacterium]|nr:DUF2062 domain-containing protein [Chromatiales bacterium]
MPRRFFRQLSRQYRPNSASWYLRPWRERLARTRVFAVNRRSVSGGLWLGVFFGCQPVPVQTLLAVGSSLAARVNPAVAALAVWVSNPLTYAPLLYAEFWIGSRLLGREPGSAAISLGSLGTLALEFWVALLLGSVVLGALLASSAWLVLNLAWRLSTLFSYRRRLQRGTPPSHPAAVPPPGGARAACVQRSPRHG